MGCASYFDSVLVVCDKSTIVKLIMMILAAVLTTSDPPSLLGKDNLLFIMSESGVYILRVVDYIHLTY